jgi:hypothetical protein
MTDVLMFIEDPGVANFMVPVIPALQKLGLSVALRVAGAAVEYIGQSSAVRGWPPEGDARAVLEAVAPRLVFTGTSENRNSLGLALISEGRARGLPTVAAVDAPSNATERFRGFSGAPLAFAPDHILVPDDNTAGALGALARAVGVTICGHPHYDSVLERLSELQREGRDHVRARAIKGRPQAPVIVFAAEISTGMVPALYQRSDDYSLHGSGRHHGRTEVVIEEFIEAVAGLTPRPHTVLRLHPKNTREELAHLLDGFDEVSQGGPGIDIVFAADAVCGMTSVLLAEAALAGRPVLAIIPRTEERVWLPQLIQRDITVAETRPALHDGLIRILKGEGVLPLNVHGGAAERAAAAIRLLL